jgi:hypothetical protein
MSDLKGTIMKPTNSITLTSSISNYVCSCLRARRADYQTTPYGEAAVAQGVTKVLQLLIWAVVLILAGFIAAPGQTPPKKSDSSSQREKLEQHLSSPDSRLTATVRFTRLLNESDLAGLRVNARVTTVWIGRKVDGVIQATNQPAYENDTPQSVLQAYRSFLKSVEKILEATKPSPDIVIPNRNIEDYGVYGLGLEGTAVQITEALMLVPNSELFNVESSPSRGPKVLSENLQASPSTPNALIPSINRRILPNRGSFQAAQSDQPGLRYVVNWFSWDNYLLLDGFKTNDSYEHQVVLDKFDGKTYLGRSRFWDSNMPGPYLDTQALNDQGVAGSATEPDWSVGTYYPKDLVPGTSYFTLIVTEEGNDSGDLGKLSGQVREYFCLDPWCVSGVQDTQFIRRFRRIDLPGNFDWVRAQINDVEPQTIPVGVDTVITLKGKDFDSPFGAKIKVGDQPEFPIHWGGQTNFINSNQVQIIVKVGDSNSPDTDFSLWLETWDGQISNEVKGLRAVRGLTPLTIEDFSWNPTPRPSQPFNGVITGTGFAIGGTEAWFCNTNSNTCYPHPAQLINVTSSTSMTVTNVGLGAGSWQFYLKTSAGQSVRSASFSVTSAGPLPTLSDYLWNPTQPLPSQNFNGTITGTNFVAGAEAWFCIANTNTCYKHGATGTNVPTPNSVAVYNVQLGAGSWQVFVKTPAGSTAKSSPFTVGQPMSAPTLLDYQWTPTQPLPSQNFNGIITGTNFVAGAEVWFCLANSNTCYPHPPTGINVTSPSSLAVINVQLGSGLWQVFVKTPGGSTAKSSTFTVGQPLSPPTLLNFLWNPTQPLPSQNFGGTITGTNFVAGAEVWFCIANSSTCYQHPPTGINVTSPTSLAVINVQLGSGSWQVFVKTSAGSTAKSSAFTVGQPLSPPTLANYVWNPTQPLPSQNFSGTIGGTNFVAGAEVWFCIANSNTCYQHPPTGINVTNSTSLSVINVQLGSGSWQVFVKTAAGSTAKSSAFTVGQPLSPPTLANYVWNPTQPLPSQNFSGTIGGTNFVAGAEVWFCIANSNTCYQHPPTGINVTSSTSLSVINVQLGSGSWQVYVKTSAGSTAKSSAFTVGQLQSPPTISSYSWNSTPFAGQFFSGNISGTNFVSGDTEVWFCVTNTSTCYQQPAAGVSVNNSTSLSVSNVSLGSGSWQFYLKTSAGSSAKSSSFTVQTPPPSPPTISSYSWNSTPYAGQAFGGNINGTGFVSGGTEVWFCVTNTSTCFQQPGAGVSVNNSNSLSVSNVNLSSGSWQFYVKTSAGSSTKSGSFTVQIPPPAISSYSWNTTPRSGQLFGGTISGSGFISGGTEVWFCITNTSTCYQQPAAGVSVNNSNSLNVTNVNLSSGSWQFYLKTSAGTSAKSSAFSVL